MKKAFYSIVLFSLVIVPVFSQAVPDDPNRGLRADWMRGALGMLWLPENTYNGNIEGKRIDDFLDQISHLKTIDFIQVGLASPYIFSPTHTAPHEVIESLWEGDLDNNGQPINLVVPRAAVDDPFLSWLLAIRAAGLKTEVYVNTCNLLEWNNADIPGVFPDLSARWKTYCNENYQDFIDSKSYHTNGTHDDRRPYMFCYAEFILKEYAIRYGDLIDAWCFDAAHVNMGAAGDVKSSGDPEDQRIYQAFANACHAGNPNAAITFNTGVGDRDSDPFVPYASPTYYEDYKFGHPFGGAGNMVEPRDPLYNVNFGVCEYMQETNGKAFREDDITWNDNIVAHFFPKQSTTSWNDGGTPCLTDEEFVEWNHVGLINGGGITWGTPLKTTNLNNTNYNLTLHDYALRQFELVDADLCKYQYPGAPNWARSYTILKEATIGQFYSDTLIEGTHFWDPEGDEIRNLFAVAADKSPSWLTIKEIEEGVWVLSGTPTEKVSTDYEFRLRVVDASGGRNRWVELKVKEEEIQTVFTSNIQIQATANTNYGIDKVATMFSGIQTAFDSLATYQISIELTPEAGKAIVSGESGGPSTTKSFGIGTTNADDFFTGSDEEWIDHIGNIKMINFSANGGDLTEADFKKASFSSIQIVNAQSTNDNVHVEFGGTLYKYGKTPTNSYDLDLEGLFGNLEVNEFAIGTGNTSTTNKWSIDGITVKVVFEKKEVITNVEILEESEVFIYPNPATNMVSFSVNPQKIELFDTHGSLILQDSSGSTSLDITSLKEGVYVIGFYKEDGSVSHYQIYKAN